MSKSANLSVASATTSSQPGFDADRATASVRPKGVYLLGGESYDLIYPASIRSEIEKYVDFVAEPIATESLASRMSDLQDVEVIFSGWNAPVMDEAFLAAAPNLKAVFYGAGSIRYCTPPAFWDREIVITSANAANAVPVAEFTLSVVLLSLKKFWSYAYQAKRGEGWGDHTRPLPGAYRSNVGLVSFGLIARRTLDLLKQFDLNISVYCPFLSQNEADELGVTLCSLDEIFSTCQVVSLHTPNLPETQGMIQKKHFAAMKPDATFINTARGAIVNEPDLIEVAQARPDLSFVLDVTWPEPPVENSPLYELPNVTLTPHIAGSMGLEIGRMGEYMLEELKLYVAGKPLRWQITREASETIA